MKSKLKMFLIILLIFFFVGCTPKLTYTILDGHIKEMVEIHFDNHYTKEELEQTLEYYSHRDGYKADTKVEEITDGYKGTITSPNISMTSYFNNDTSTINGCYEIVNFSYEEDEQKYYLNTSKGFQCMIYDYNVVDDLSITVQTYNKVYKHNADEVNGNKYTWYINKDNAKEQSILFVVGNKEYVWYYRFKDLFIGLGVVSIIVIVLTIVLKIFKLVNKSVNHI